MVKTHGFPVKISPSQNHSHDLRRSSLPRQGEERGEAEDGRRGGAGRVPGGQRQGRALRTVPWDPWVLLVWDP